jgi:hypothetical protein
MASFTYDQFREVLKKTGFEKIRSQKHETWRKILSNGVILRIRISHQHQRDIPKWLFYEMLRQAGLDEEQFVRVLRG